MCESVVYPNILWRVENFTPNAKKHGPTVSLLLSKWKFKLVTYRCVGGDKVQLFLKRFPDNTHSVETCFHVFTSISCSDGVKYLEKAMKVPTTTTKLCMWEVTIDELIRCNSNFQYCMDLLISFVPGKDWRNYGGIKFDTTDKSVRPSLPVLNQDFGNLLSGGSHADVVLICGDKKFKAHRAILSARSDTFKTKLQSVAAGKQEVINIDDINCTVLEIVLRYIYMGEIPDIPLPSEDKQSLRQ